jgi:AAA15 family ATPase/GTPase
MLIQFTTANFLSFKDPVTLSMVAGKIRSKNKLLDEGATFTLSDELKLLKCALVYGANASGKSNLFAALRFMKALVLESSKESQAGEAINTKPFRLITGFDDQPSSFEITFSLAGIMYQYAFSADHHAIHTESLIAVNKNKQETLFERDREKITLHKKFLEGKLLIEKTRKNALFLSVCANFDGTISSQILQWFRKLNIVSGTEDSSLMAFTRQCLAGDKQAQISALLKNFDLGIERIALGDVDEDTILRAKAPKSMQQVLDALDKLAQATGVPSRAVINSYHKTFDSQGTPQNDIAFDFRDESEGSKKLVALSGPLVDTLENACVLFIDEFDARLHPILSRKIVEIFNSSNLNPSNAQLIVATHDTNLLDKELLRRDQIWFVEKDQFGASHLTSLVEFRVRNDASFEKDYIMGKYGAIPLLGNMRQIFEPPGTSPNLTGARNGE